MSKMKSFAASTSRWGPGRETKRARAAHESHRSIFSGYREAREYKTGERCDMKWLQSF